MRHSRHNKIIELIETHEIDTQEALSNLLEESGFHVTQATISRDIKTLQLVKVLSSQGKYRYSVNSSDDHPLQNRYHKIIRESVISVSSSDTIVVVRTIPECADLVARYIHKLELEHTLAVLPGIDSVLIVADSPKNIESVKKQLGVHIYEQGNGGSHD